MDFVGVDVNGSFLTIDEVIRFGSESRVTELLLEPDLLKSSADFSLRRRGSVAYLSKAEDLLSSWMLPTRVRMMSVSGATDVPRAFLLLLEIEGQRPSSTVGVESGVRLPRFSDGVLDRFTRGLEMDRFIGKESGFGGRFVDMERVSEVVMPIFGSSGLDLSRDRARSRVARFGATDFDGSVLERLTVGGRGDLEDVDSLDLRGDSFKPTFFLPAPADFLKVGPPVTDEDSLPPSLA